MFYVKIINKIIKEGYRPKRNNAKNGEGASLRLPGELK
jgi:hypothetical protein